MPKTNRLLKNIFVFLLGWFTLTLVNPTIHVLGQSINNDIKIYSIFVNRSTNSATISWKTDPATKGSIEYADGQGVWKNIPWDDNFLEQHSTTILSLEADATYLYKISAEDTNGSVKTKTGNFTTLSSSILGQSTDITSTPIDDGGFRFLLSPAPNPTPTPAQSMLNPQGYPYMPFYPIAVPFIYQYPQTTPPQVLGATTNDTPNETPTTTPTPVPFLLTANMGSMMLILGLTIGVAIAFMLHQISQSKQNKVHGTKTTPTNQHEVSVTDEPNKKFTFTLDSTAEEQ